MTIGSSAVVAQVIPVTVQRAGSAARGVPAARRRASSCAVAARVASAYPMVATAPQARCGGSVEVAAVIAAKTVAAA